MKQIQTTIIAILSLTSAAIAQDKSGPRTAIYRGQFSAIAEDRSAALDKTTHNANDCASDRAEPVWSDSSALLGYACVALSVNQ
jgi:hypothetical protein